MIWRWEVFPKTGQADGTNCYNCIWYERGLKTRKATGCNIVLLTEKETNENISPAAIEYNTKMLWLHKRIKKKWNPLSNMRG